MQPKNKQKKELIDIFSFQQEDITLGFEKMNISEGILVLEKFVGI